MGRPGIVLYFDMLEPIRVLPDSDKGRLLVAMLEYGQMGTQPRFEGMLALAWGFVKLKLDRDAGMYEKTKEQRRYAAYCKQRSAQNLPKVSFEEWRKGRPNSNGPLRADAFDAFRYPTITETEAESESITETVAVAVTETPCAAAAAESGFRETERYRAGMGSDEHDGTGHELSAGTCPPAESGFRETERYRAGMGSDEHDGTGHELSAGTCPPAESGFRETERYRAGMGSDEHDGTGHELSAGTCPPAENAVKAFGGELGRNVVFLSDAQVEDLLEQMDLEVFDYYVDKLAAFIQKNGARVKNHYETILRWYREDGRRR